MGILFRWEIRSENEISRHLFVTFCNLSLQQKAQSLSSSTSYQNDDDIDFRNVESPRVWKCHLWSHRLKISSIDMIDLAIPSTPSFCSKKRLLLAIALVLFVLLMGGIAWIVLFFAFPSHYANITASL